MINNTLKRLAKWYFSRGALPYWCILGLDCLFVLFSGLLTSLINHGVSNTVDIIAPLCCTLLLALVCYIVGFRCFHTYQGVFRYSSFSDLLRISSAILTGIIIFSLVQWLIGQKSMLATLTFADIILMGLFVITFMWTMRMLVKNLYEMIIHIDDREQVFILGVKEGGVAIAKSIHSSSDMPYQVRGFVSDEPNMRSYRLLGLKVYPFDKSLVGIMHTLRIKTLIVSPLMMDAIKSNTELMDYLITNDIKFLILQRAKEWDLKSDLSVNDLQPVAIENLLPREKIEVDLKAASDLIKDNIVMITGAAGSIGSEIVRQTATYKPAHLILIDQAETPMHDIRLMMQNRWPKIKTETIVSDIGDKKIMDRIFKKYKPDYVFHAAAYKHVPMMEDNPYEAIVNNVSGTKIIADLAVKYGTRKFVMVSTDKAVNPTNVMGCSKRICEIYVQSLDQAIKDGKREGKTQFVTTRFGNVLGSNGSVIPIFQEQIKHGGPVTVTHPDIIRFFMLIQEACRLVIEAGTMGKGGEIYVFDMGKPVRIADLAKRMILLSGAKNVEIKYTGLRDGEKLYEEVLNDEETTLSSSHPKIKIAKVRLYEFNKIESIITEMINAAEYESDMEIVARMKKIVPEFKSQHSKYEILDK